MSHRLRPDGSKLESVMSNTTNETSVGPGEIMPVFRMIIFQRINRILCSILGIPLNIVVVTVILRSRQLWSARNIFWLAVTFFNLLALAQSMTELIIFYLNRRADGSHEILCTIYSSFLGYPYALLLTGLTLASYDRYLALTCKQFYQNHATPKNIVSILVCVFLAITAGQISPYWLGILPMKCSLSIGWISLTLIFQGVLSFACLIVQIRLYLFVRSCIRYAPCKKSVNMELTTRHLNGSISSTVQQNTQVLENVDRSLNRLELRAARILGLGIFPFCLMTLTLCANSVALFFFRYRGLDGFWIQIVMIAFRESLLIHLVYIPSVFIAQSREFRAAVKRFFRHRQPKSVGQYS